MNEIWALGLIDETGYNGIKDKHIDKMARVVLDYNIDITNREELIYCCKKALTRLGSLAITLWDSSREPPLASFNSFKMNW